MKRLLSYFYLVAAACLLPGVSCTREEVPGTPGTITISLETLEMETKAGEGSLLIAVANYSGTVVAKYPATGELIAESTVEFHNINPGTYTVYAVKDADAATATAFSGAATASALDAITLSSFSELAIPMAAKGSVSVNAGGNGQVNLALERVCARVSLSFLNETGEAISVSNCSVTLEKMNPAGGYLIGRDADYISGVTPPDLMLSHPGAVAIENLQSSDYSNLSALVFPSKAPAHRPGYRYLCTIRFTVGGEEYEFTDLPVHDRRSADIQSVKRNQHLMIETRIGKKIEDKFLVSFHFEVTDWVYEEPSFVWFH